MCHVGCLHRHQTRQQSGCQKRMRLDSSKRLGCSGSDSSRLAGFDNHGQGASKIARVSPKTLRSGAERISMSRVETVEDPEDPRLIDYRETRDADRRRRSGTFIAEGREVVRRLLRTRRYEIRSALVTPPASPLSAPLSPRAACARISCARTS